jgi:hypothetical protein
MGDESGGGGGGAPKGASVRGQVGLTKKEQNQRAVAQEKGGRQSAGVAGPSSRAGAAPSRDSLAGQFSRNYGAMSPEDVAETEMDRSVDQFTTSTTGAYRDLDDRVNKGQISERIQNLPLVGMAATGLNKLGKYTAGKIRSGIEAGGTPVYDTIGRIRGVVSKNALGRDVYTGGGVDPVADPSGTRLQKGIGYVQNERAAFGNYGPVGLGMKTGGGSGATVGGDSGDSGVKTTQTAATATDVTGSTTSLSSAARRLAAGGAAGGATTRRFLG